MGETRERIRRVEKRGRYGLLEGRGGEGGRVERDGEGERERERETTAITNLLERRSRHHQQQYNRRRQHMRGPLGGGGAGAFCACGGGICGAACNGKKQTKINSLIILTHIIILATYIVRLTLNLLVETLGEVFRLVILRSFTKFAK